MIGWIMERETMAQNDAAIAALELRPHERVLEIGHGPGRALERIAALVPHGFVAGIDHSADMHAVAAARCARLIDERSVELQVGDSCALPYADATFHKALAVHTLYFWNDALAHLREAHRVLRRDGVLVLGFRPAHDPHSADFPTSVYTFYSPDAVAVLLRAAGFADVAIGEPLPGLVLARAFKRA